MPEDADVALLSLARDLRARAEEVLARAETFHDAGAREMMRRIAASYEKLARRLEIESGAAGGA